MTVGCRFAFLHLGRFPGLGIRSPTLLVFDLGPVFGIAAIGRNRRPAEAEHNYRHGNRDYLVPERKMLCHAFFQFAVCAVGIHSDPPYHSVCREALPMALPSLRHTPIFEDKRSNTLPPGCSSIGFRALLQKTRFSQYLKRNLFTSTNSLFSPLLSGVSGKRNLYGAHGGFISVKNNCEMPPDPQPLPSRSFRNSPYLYIGIEPTGWAPRGHLGSLAIRDGLR